MPIEMEGPIPAKEKENLPMVDISGETNRQVVIAAGTKEVYQGHPTTVLMPDSRTIYCVWTYDHGGPCGPLKKSTDGGQTWSGLLIVPVSWSTIYNCPSIYRLTDPFGVERLCVFAAHAEGKNLMQQAVSEDGGHTWSSFRSLGIPCEMAFTTIAKLNRGDYLGMYPRRKDDRGENPIEVWQSLSKDGGLTWKEPTRACEDSARGRDPDEPELIRSPDGKQLLCLLRENLRQSLSLMMVSNNEGATWSDLRETPWGLTGDRHKARYANDGRIVVACRDMAPHSPTKGSFVAWVGTYDDIIKGRPGQYRIKLLHQYPTPGVKWSEVDCGYPGLELLPDGTFVATTYVKYRPGPEKNSVVSVRFKLEEIDKMARRQK